MELTRAGRTPPLKRGFALDTTSCSAFAGAACLPMLWRKAVRSTTLPAAQPAREQPAKLTGDQINRWHQNEKSARASSAVEPIPARAADAAINVRHAPLNLDWHPSMTGS